MSRRGAAALLALTAVLASTGCQGGESVVPSRPPPSAAGPAPVDEPTRVVTLGFAGDVHFQLHLATLLDHPRGALGPITRTLRRADLTMVNLESAITSGGTRDPKELETPADRYWFRAPPAALDVLERAGVDVVTMANNHGADYGPDGLADTLRAARRSPIPVVGVGPDRGAALTPYRVTVNDTDLAFFAADASPREGSSSVWEAGAATPGSPPPATRGRSAPSRQRSARPPATRSRWSTCTGGPRAHVPEPRAGADGAGPRRRRRRRGRRHPRPCPAGRRLARRHLRRVRPWQLHLVPRPPSRQRSPPAACEGRARGVRRVGPRADPALRSTTAAARRVTHSCGRPVARAAGLRGSGCPTAPGIGVRRWRLAWRPAGVQRVHSADRAGAADTHALHPRPGCPVPWSDLRYLRLSHVGFDGRHHLGELVVAARHARDVAGVFARLYDARWPIRQMRLASDFDGDDARSMAADNTSAYNCRRVAGSATWSNHAFGAAIDINPVENPYLVDGSVRPADGRSFAQLDRSAGSSVRPGPSGRVTSWSGRSRRSAGSGAGRGRPPTTSTSPRGAGERGRTRSARAVAALVEGHVDPLEALVSLGLARRPRRHGGPPR